MRQIAYVRMRYEIKMNLLQCTKLTLLFTGFLSPQATIMRRVGLTMRMRIGKATTKNKDQNNRNNDGHAYGDKRWWDPEQNEEEVEKSYEDEYYG